MGVVYKFKDEVINFVLLQKENHPSLSCRQLADIVSKQFEVQVSKSSVNTILKNAQLSSPVGRRPLTFKQPKAFQIPTTKKKEIFGETPSEERDHKKEIAVKVKAISSAPQRTVKPPANVPHIRPAAHPAEPKISPLPRIATPSSAQRHDGLGNIFLKAIEWSISSKPVLGEILKDYANGFSIEDIYAASQILLHLRPFGLATVEDLLHYKGTGLWKLNQLSAGFDPRIVKNFFESLTSPEEIGFRLVNEIEQLFTEISYFKIICEDGQEILIDGAWETTLTNNVQSVNFSLYNKLLSNLTDNIINPKGHTLLQRAPGQTALTKEFYDFLMVFENKPGKTITAVSLFDSHGTELSKFTSVPPQHRSFILAIWPWQKEFDHLTASSLERHREEVLHPLTEQRVYFTEVNRQALGEVTRHLCPSMRGYLVTLTDERASKGILLTNTTKEQIPAKEVVLSYLMRWPTWQTISEKQAIPVVADEALFVPSGDLNENIHALVSKIEQYAFKQFIGKNSMNISDFTSICSKMSGYWQDYREYAIISLIPSDEMTMEKVRLFQEAAVKFNQACISDPSGMRIFVKMS